jgi:hypothetical protein
MAFAGEEQNSSKRINEERNQTRRNTNTEKKEKAKKQATDSIQWCHFYLVGKQVLISSADETGYQKAKTTVRNTEFLSIWCPKPTQTPYLISCVPSAPLHT